MSAKPEKCFDCSYFVHYNKSQTEQHKKIGLEAFRDTQLQIQKLYVLPGKCRVFDAGPEIKSEKQISQ